MIINPNSNIMVGIYKYLSIASIIILSLQAHAQEVQYSVQLNSGFYRYTGESSEKASLILYNSIIDNSYTSNPYGNNYALSYGLAGKITRITRKNLRLGLEAGVEVLRSRVDIHGVWLREATAFNQVVPVEGSTYLESGFVNLFPSMGYQYSSSRYTLYFDGGMDVAFGIFSKEEGRTESLSDRSQYNTSHKRNTIDLDLRPRIQLGLKRDEFGVYIGYSYGLINYLEELDGGSFYASSEMLRIGFSYDI